MPYVTGTVNRLLLPTTRVPPPIWRALPCVKNVSELIARHVRPFNFFIAHKPTKSLRGTLVNVKNPLQTPKQWNVVCHIPCSDCPTGRQLSTRVKEHNGIVRRQDEHCPLALHCLTTDHAFDWGRASVIGKETTELTRDFIEAWNTTSTCVNHCVALDPGYRALRDYWPTTVDPDCPSCGKEPQTVEHWPQLLHRDGRSVLALARKTLLLGP